MNGKITIEIDAKEGIAMHNLALEKALTKRNLEIERLKQRIEAGEGSEYAKKQYEMGYKRGWIDSASEMMSQSRKAAEYLNGLHRTAFESYLKGDRLTVMGQRIGGDL